MRWIPDLLWKGAITAGFGLGVFLGAGILLHTAPGQLIQDGINYQLLSQKQSHKEISATESDLKVLPGESRPTDNTATNMLVVPLKEDSRALMVDATLNDAVGGTFIVDTGATYTSITQEMAEALHVDTNTGKTVAITTANGRIEVPKVTIDRIRINGVEARNVEATVINVRKGSSFSGLLGLSFIRQFRMTIDPQGGQLLFQPLSQNSPAIGIRGKSQSA